MNRRRLLLAGGAALMLPGCGSGGGGPAPAEDPDAPTRVEIDGDIELLHGLLELEVTALALYEGRGDGALFARLAEHERVHAERLRAAIRALGSSPAPALGADVGDGDPLRLARRVEQTAIAAYVDALPKVSDPDVRELVATIAASEAAHLAAVDGALGRLRAPKAFVTGARRL